jgi:hypothetical protein
MGDEVMVELFSTDVDADELDRMAAALRRDLLDIPEVDKVAPVSAGPAPAGTRAVDVTAIGAFLVTVKPSIELLSKVVGVVRGWLRRSGEGTLKITVNGSTLELTPTQEQQEELVRAFLKQAASTEDR